MRNWSAGALRVLAGTLALGACQKTVAAPFPQVDRDKLRISLFRSACLGTCPDYKVTIDGRGHVVFSTRDELFPGAAKVHRKFSLPYVVAPGRHEYAVDPSVVDDLLKKFRDARFFDLKDEYSAGITDNPTFIVEIDTGHGRKKVIDYVGQMVGMPSAVTELEAAIDHATLARAWVDGADGLAPLLERERFDFHSEGAAVMLLGATDDGGDGTLAELVQRGAPLDMTLEGKSYGSRILLRAIEKGRAALFKTLVDRGWLERTSRSDIGSAFAASGAGCSPELVDAAVAAGIPVDATTNRDYDEQMSSSGGAETALAAVGHSFSCDDKGTAVRVAERLLAHGADPNKRNASGETPIFAVEDLALLELLLSHGADAKLVDAKGNSAVVNSWTDEIVLRLLQAGASPKGRYYDGKTLLQQMKARPMPKVKAWLDAHPEAMALAKST